MTFDTIEFVAFFAGVFLLYHFLGRSYKAQNVLIVATSMVFYGWWSREYLLLMIGSVSINYIAAIFIAGTDSLKKKRLWLTVGVIADLLILCTFKYAGFFIDNIVFLLHHAGIPNVAPTLKIILPIGISFYTFQGMAYLIDVYRGHIEAERDPIVFLAFKLYFPQLIAGPIERAWHLMPQFKKPRVLEDGVIRESIWLICYGYFLKVVISGPLSQIVGMCFSETATSGWNTILGTIAFTVQIYCDFNAYSIIARGASGLLGIRLMWNFNQPYIACSIQDFWRRWHISLSTWLRDYLYISLGGNRKGNIRTYVNLFLTMLIGGLWHGAAWNFIIWGAWHGAALAADRYFLRGKRESEYRFNLFKWALTMVVVMLGWFIFRCHSLDMAGAMIKALGDMSWSPGNSMILARIAVLVTPVAFFEILQAYRKCGYLFPFRSRAAFVPIAALMVALTIIMFGRFTYEFIYFQF